MISSHKDRIKSAMCSKLKYWNVCTSCEFESHTCGCTRYNIMW